MDIHEGGPNDLWTYTKVALMTCVHVRECNFRWGVGLSPLKHTPGARTNHQVHLHYADVGIRRVCVPVCVHITTVHVSRHGPWNPWHGMCCPTVCMTHACADATVHD